MAQNVVGIRYVEAGPLHYCSPGDLRLGIGDYVIVSSERGERLGWVVLTPEQVIGGQPEGPLRIVTRLASAEEVEQHRDQRRRAQEDLGRAQAAAARVDPRARVASLEYDLAGDFAELTYVARDNAAIDDRVHREVLRVIGPIDLRVEQVGDRDRAKAVGGLGQCGRALCCSTWMTEFPAISIKMAKDQGLAPNPSKISGVCGRLLCCLSFEVEAYREIVGSLPKVGKRLTTPIGKAKVLSINALTEMVRLRFDETGQIIEISTEAVKRQMGTTLRPDELDAEFEEALREKDRRRTENLVGILTPVDRPLRDASAAGGPQVDEAEREERRRRRTTSPRPGSPRPARRSGETPSPGGRPASGGGTRRRGARPAAGGQPRGARPEGEGETRSGVRITRRRAGQPGGASNGPNASNTGAPARSPSPRPQPPRAEGAPGGVEGDAQRRRRRRGRRGGRGRSEGGAGGSEGAPPPSAD